MIVGLKRSEDAVFAALAIFATETPHDNAAAFCCAMWSCRRATKNRRGEASHMLDLFYIVGM